MLANVIFAPMWSRLVRRLDPQRGSLENAAKAVEAGARRARIRADSGKALDRAVQGGH